MEYRNSVTNGARGNAKRTWAHLPGSSSVRAIATLVIALLIALPAVAVSKDVNLNGGDTTNESTVSLTVVTTSPVKIQNKITNRAAGQAFRFAWKSAGPGGFSSSLGTGTTAGVGSIWTWQTTSQVYVITPNPLQCTNDICLNRTLPADNASRGPFNVPGRSLTPSNVTVTNESLSSSLITFFSPPQELFRYTSSVEQLAPGVFRYKTILENNTGGPITVDQSPGPIGCETECGNSVREGQEVCDGSDLSGQSCANYDSVGTLGCAEDCRSYDLSGCTPSVCGNNTREPGETCDGTALDDQSCESQGGGGGPLTCQPDCHGFDVSECVDVCGNGIADDKEQCDGTDLNGETCESRRGGSGSTASLGGTLACYGNCTFDVTQCTDICGNGTIDAGETCDGSNLGNASCADVEQGGTVFCDSNCQVDYGDCTPYYCGNGSIDTEGEECDGSDLGENDCTDFGASGGTLGCTPSCSFDFSGCTDYCGNGVREGEESCDGSDLNGRTCDDFGGNGTLGCDGCGFDTHKCFPQGTIDCKIPGSTAPVPASSTVETCEISAHPAKEVTTKIEVCGEFIPDGPDSCGTEEATSGTANVFVPDPDTVIGPVFFTSSGLHIVDTDMDQVPQPGETVQIFIPLLNAGTRAVSNVHAVLTSPAYDIDGDGDQDPVVINVGTAFYPNGACFAGLPSGSGDCHTVGTPPDPCTNLMPFVVTFPHDHPADVGRKFILTIFYDETALLGVTSQTTRSIVLGVGGSICGNGILESDEDCDDGNRTSGDCCSSTCQYETQGSPCADDGNPCTNDACDGAGVCARTPNTAPCEDGNRCTTGDACRDGSCVPGGPLDCNDPNPCTDDSCNPSSGCVHTNNAVPCDDGSVCTTNDTCSGGACHGGAALDCNDGNVCTTDTCDPSAGCINSCNNNCNAKGDGYWKHLCQNRQHHHDDHSDDHGDDEFYTHRDVDCVNDSCTFSDVQTIDMLCGELDDHGGDKCEKAEKKFMALLLNVCRCRLQPDQTIDAHCEPHHQTVAEVVAHEDATLCNPSRTQEQCKHPECAADDLVNGQALWQNTLRLTRQRTGILVSWQSVYGEPTIEATRKYRIWRRVFGSTVPYTMIGEVNDHTFSFLDTTAGSGSFAYEVTATY